MANDGGITAQLEQFIADTLAAMQSGGENVFRTADVYKYQISADAGGIEAFSRYEPFAFVSYWPAGDAAREGDYDLRQVWRFAILIGIESTGDGVARIGDANHLGASKIRDLVIAGLDGQHPGGDLDCDELYYTGETELLDSPKKYAFEMHFTTNRVGD
ncbi:MAG TPA: hypothetical protein HPP51_00815 [Planctomycetes bacterium]|nr:hypothetical protein [Planctomycetota bacterium]